MTPMDTPFTPRQVVLDTLPDVKGNDINGLGEDALRPPSPVMWHDSSILAHGNLQDWFAANGMAPGAAGHRKENLEYSSKPLPPLADKRPDWSVEEWTAQVKAAALDRETDIVGIARLDKSTIFEGYEAPYDWVIVLVVAMDYDCLSTAPSRKSQVEVQHQYTRGTRAAYRLAAWMRERGWDAVPHGGPRAGPILMIPHAIAAGMGELGKHGSMINRQYGSSFRLACVMTNLPLIADAPDQFGADDFCVNCQVCTNVCPVDAIQPDKQMVRGERKWYVDFDDCILYFVENNGCGICIGQCPWSRTGTAPRLAEKLTRRQERTSARTPL